MIEQVLQNIGLTPNEAKVYLALLPMKKGCASVVSEKIGVHKNGVRLAFEKLEDIGLVKKIKRLTGMMFFYSAESPNKIFDILKAQQQKVEERRDNFCKIFSDLKSLVDPTIILPDVQYYEGKSEIIRIYEDIIETADHGDKRVYSWQDIGKIEEVIGKDYVEHYIQQRELKNIVSQSIMPKNNINIAYSKAKQSRNSKIAEGLDIKGQIKIYGTKTALITLKKEQPIGFVIQGEIMASFFKSIFRNHWENL